MVTLMPVQGYPIEKKIEEDDDSSMQADTSLYNEDGSLEVWFTLCHVLLVVCLLSIGVLI